MQRFNITITWQSRWYPDSESYLNFRWGNYKKQSLQTANEIFSSFYTDNLLLVY